MHEAIKKAVKGCEQLGILFLIILSFHWNLNDIGDALVILFILTIIL